jgi:hypothetical protein
MVPDSNKLVKEEGCFAVTFERKYYQRGDVFIKRMAQGIQDRVSWTSCSTCRQGEAFE